MKRIIMLLFTVSISVILASCGHYKDIQEELLRYYNEEWVTINVWYKSETYEAEKKIRDIIFEQREEGEDVMIVREEEIIPAVKEVLERFKSIQLEHKPVKKLNELQIEIQELDRDSDILANDYIKGDIPRSELYEIWGELEQKREEFDEYLDELVTKYNLEWDKEKFRGYNYHELKRWKD